MTGMRRARLVGLLAALMVVVAACGGAGSAGSSGGEEVASDASAETAGGGGDDAGEPAPGVTDDEILIGGFGPTTGPASWIGLGTRDGFTMALEEINEAGGVHGRKLRLEFFDDAYEVATAQRVIRRLISDVQPFMIYSGTGSTVFVSVHEMLRESGVPTYNGFSGTELVRKDPEAPNMFHGHAVSAKWVQEGLVQLVSDLGAERVAVMHEVGEWGRSVCEPTIELLESELGITPTTLQTYATGDTDFSGQLVAVRDSDPQLVINCGLYPEAAVILQQARELGIDALFIGDTAQGNQSVWGRAGQAAENFIFNWYSPYFLTDPEGPMAEFRERYAERYPDAPEGRPAHSDTFAYGDAYIIAEALERAGENPTRESFQEAMKTIEDFESSPFNARANFNNERNDGFSETTFMRVVDGEAVFVDEEQTAELRDIVAGL